MSPVIGGSWASMSNTPLVPMFGNKNGDDGMAPGDYGASSSPNLEGASARLGNWSANGGNGAGIVLDDVRKFRRSARVSGTAVSGGALSGMYDEPSQQRRSSPQHNSSQQNAINLGLAGLQQQQSYSNNSQQNAQSRNGAASPGLLSAQHSAITAQQNWRNGLGSPNPLTAGSDQSEIFAQQLTAFGMNSALQNTGNLSANVQLANLFALQQQMIQQQQQMQQLGMAAAAAGMTLSPNQQALLSPGGRMNMGGMSPMGMLSPMGSNMGLSLSLHSSRLN